MIFAEITGVTRVSMDHKVYYSQKMSNDRVSMNQMADWGKERKVLALMVWSFVTVYRCDAKIIFPGKSWALET